MRDDIGTLMGSERLATEIGELLGGYHPAEGGIGLSLSVVAYLLAVRSKYGDARANHALVIHLEQVRRLYRASIE